MEQLHLMTGRYASQTLTFPDSAQDAAGKREHFPALIFNYSKQPQSFATVTTRGQPMRRLMYTDDVFLHRFLHYFAADMLGQPRLKLQGHNITLRWQRQASDDAAPKADQQLVWGEWVELDTLPAQAVLQVHGEALPTTADSLSIQ